LKFLKPLLFSAIFIYQSSFAFYHKNGHFSAELGPYYVHQAHFQHINIEGLIGNDFQPDYDKSDLIVGLGYYLQGLETDKLIINYGINGYYFTLHPTGTVVQEGVYSNLSYAYDIRNLPIYAAAQFELHPHNSISYLIDAGLGINFLAIEHYQEHSLDNGLTQPDNAFYGLSKKAWSSSVGFGFKLNSLKDFPIEFKYRFFYLGQSNFRKTNPQVINKLQTGRLYAHAITASVSF